ncbi:hypothetical protein ACFE04_015481 [Oxalis oulophora]
MIEDVTRLSLASKHYENLCLTVPKLAIDGDQCSPKRVRFLDYLVTFIKRRNSAKLTNLFLSWGVSVTGLPLMETVSVMWLLNQVMLCHVNNVILELNFGDFDLLVPLRVFCTQSLTSLSILLSNGRLQFPSPYGVSNLKHLFIDQAHVVQNDSLGEWMSSVCTCLEKLWLTKIYGLEKFNISIKSLQEIEIVSCNLDFLDITSQSLETLNLIEAFDLSSNSSLKVCAPNLLILDVSGNCIEYFTVKTSISKFSVSLCPKACPATTLELKSLLSSIVHVTELTIDHFSLQEIPVDSDKASLFDLNVWESWVFEEGLVDFLLKINAIKLKKLTISSKHSIPKKLVHKLDAFVAAAPDRAELTSLGNKMVVERQAFRISRIADSLVTVYDSSELIASLEGTKLHGPADMGLSVVLLHKAATSGIVGPEAGFITLNKRLNMLRELERNLSLLLCQIEDSQFLTSFTIFVLHNLSW